MLKTFALMFVLSFVAARAIAQAPATAARLDAIANSYTTGHRFMGSVLVAEGDTVLLKKGYGEADVQWSVPATPEVRYRLGSLTKQFTAALILLMQQDGKLEIAGSVRRYLPSAPASWEPVTIADLLAHTSGVPDLTRLPAFPIWTMSPHTPSESIAFFSDKPLDFKPGSQFQYSNSNYIVLGAVLEHVSGHRYVDLLHERILQPLNMNDSGLDTDDTIVLKHAQGYRLDHDSLRNARAGSMTVPWSAGAIYSTTEDLLRWQRGLFGGAILSKASLDSMTAARMDEFGFGVEVHNRNGLKVVEHSGSIEGFNTHMIYLPERKISVIVLGNVNGRIPDILAKQLFNVVLGQRVILPAERKTLPIGTVALTEFAGIYDLGDAATGGFTLTLAVQAGILKATGGDGNPMTLLYQGLRNGHPIFYQPDLDAELEFLPDANHAMRAVVLHQNAKDTPGKRR